MHASKGMYCAALAALLALGAPGCDDTDSDDTDAMAAADTGPAIDGAPEADMMVAQVDVCPQDGRGTLIIDISATGVELHDADRIVYGLFTEWPPTRAPTRAEVLETVGLTLPLRHVDTAVPPGDYAVYVCLDPGSDTSVEEVCNDGDHWVAIDGGALQAVEGGRITRAEMDLADGTGALVGSDPPEMHGCDPVEPMLDPARLTTTLVSDSVMLGPSDLGGVYLFPNFPPTGPPAKVAIGPLMSFPAEYVIEDILPGDYHIAACVDVGGDTPDCRGEGDLLVWHADGAAFTFEPGADEAVELEFVAPAE